MANQRPLDLMDTWDTPQWDQIAPILRSFNGNQNAPGFLNVGVDDTSVFAGQFTNAAGDHFLASSLDASIALRVQDDGTHVQGVSDYRGDMTSFDSNLHMTNGNFTVDLGSATLTNGNLLMTLGNATLTNGSLLLTQGHATLTQGNLLVSAGNVTITNGQFLITAGNATLTQGNLVLTLGNATLTNGSLLLTLGNATLTKGNLLVSEGTTTLVGITTVRSATATETALVVTPTTAAQFVRIGTAAAPLLLADISNAVTLPKILIGTPVIVPNAIRDRLTVAGGRLYVAPLDPTGLLGSDIAIALKFHPVTSTDTVTLGASADLLPSLVVRNNLGVQMGRWLDSGTLLIGAPIVATGLEKLRVDGDVLVNGFVSLVTPPTVAGVRTGTLAQLQTVVQHLLTALDTRLIADTTT